MRPGTTAGNTSRAGNLPQRDLRREAIRVVMRGEALTVPSGTTLAAGIAALQAARGECLLVTRDGILVGILTERDILFKVLGRDVDLLSPIDLFMTARPDTLTPDDTVGEALALTDRGGYRHVPLTDGHGRPVALLRQQDVIAYLAEAFPEEILNLPPRPHQRMAGTDGA
jgi:CBS domain-containing protein